MAAKNSETTGRKTKGRTGFQISGGPVVSDRDAGSASVLDYGQLPTSYGTPILFAIPRDPQTIFTYWNIDWSQALARKTPADRQIYLRLKRGDGSDEFEEAIEPMLGTHFVSVSQPKGAYQVDLGFYEPANVWNSIATSDMVTMPAATSSANTDIDVATVPFHLSFQRMIDMFRAENGNAIASILSRLQGRAGSSRDDLSDQEREVLQAMDFSLADLEAARRDFNAGAIDDLLRKRAEAILGFGGTSPAGGLGGSSWSSGR